MSESRQLTNDDKQHIARLQQLRQAGTHNMFTECKAGLKAHFGEDGEETYEWVVENYKYFESAAWRDVEVHQ